MTILVVDDDAGARRTMVDLLMAHGIERILTAETKHEALRRFRNDPAIRVVISDFHLPDGNGHELHAELHPELHARGAKFVAMSGKFTETTVKYFERHGVDLIHKPHIWKGIQSVARNK